MSTATQANRQISVWTPLGEDVLLLESMTGHEELSRGAEYHLELRSTDHEIKFEDIVGQPITVNLTQPGGAGRSFGGIVVRFEQIPTAGQFAHYRATAVTWTTLLEHSRNCRIFQEQTTPEIVIEVCKQHGFCDVELALSETYEPRQYCVQYRETDLDFINRLLEEEGIYTFFRHGPGVSTLVLADSIVAHELVEGSEAVPFRLPGAEDRYQECVWDWGMQRTLHTSRVALRSYDYRQPKKALDAASQAVATDLPIDSEAYDYPGHYREHVNGETLARLRMEEHQSRYQVASATTNARGLYPGALFELVESPRADQNAEYLLVAADYELRSNAFSTVDSAEAEGPVFTQRIQVIASSESFRPARITSAPRILGPQTAIVVGQSEAEIWTDPLGRVKVQFHWDREGEANENSSCWIRVAQSIAGNRWGSLHLPRIGQEVIVEFLHGNPDLPIITGSVYNGDQMPPYPLPENATMSGYRSCSSKGGDGFNEFRFEDKKGSEQVFLHAERDLDIQVKNDRHEQVGGEYHEVIEKDTRRHMKNNHHIKVDLHQMEEIGKDRNLIVGGKEARKIEGSMSMQVGTDLLQSVKADNILEVGGTQQIQANEMTWEAASKITLKVGGSELIITPGKIMLKAPEVVVDGELKVLKDIVGFGDIATYGNVDASKHVLCGGASVRGATEMMGPLTVAASVNCVSVVSSSYTPGAGNIM